MKINESQENKVPRVGLRHGYRRLVLKPGCISESPRGFTKNTDNQAPPPHPPEQNGPSSLHRGGNGDQGWGLKSRI